MKEKTLDIFRKIAPDVMGTIRERYLLLRQISDAEPIGRRTLATLSGLSERVVRAHVDVLRRSGLVRFTAMGITLEPEGKRLMPELLECFLRLNNLEDMQQRICTALQLEDVYIVPGDCDSDGTAREEMGRQAALLLSDLLAPDRIVAISGGSTMAEVAHCLSESNAGSVVVPARGGIGNHVEFQANYIAANVAEKIHGTYRMIHIPDGMSPSALKLMLQSDERAQENVALAQKAHVVVFGIGRADVMAKRRGLSASESQTLFSKQACGESLGCYCSLPGEIVHVTNNVGISLKDIKQHPHVIAVSGGTAKAEAILAVMRACHTGILVTDEGAAKKILTML